MQPHCTPESNPIPNAPGIYRIRCTATERIYVGSAINLRMRQSQHFHHLRHGTHANPKLQAAWNKYGEQFFIFEVLELVLLPLSLTAREQYWFRELNPFGTRGFNIASLAGSSLGVKASPETRAKQSASRMGREISDETRRKISDANTGKKRSQETRENIRISKLGTKQSEETKRKRAEKRTGQKHSPETLKKMGIAQLGHPVKPETRAKLRAANIGKQQNPESKSHQMREIVAISPDGIEYRVRGIKRFCREHDLHYSSLSKVAQGKFAQHKGWHAYYPAD